MVFVCLAKDLPLSLSPYFSNSHTLLLVICLYDFWVVVCVLDRISGGLLC